MSTAGARSNGQPPLPDLLAGDEGADLLRHAARIQLAPGEEASAPPDHLLVLAEGEAARHREGRLVELIDAPAVLGLVEVVTRAPLRDSLEARTACSLLRLPGCALRDAMARSPVLLGRVAERLAHAALVEGQERFQLLLGCDDFFSAAPGALLLPGPYRCGPYRALQFVMEASPGELDALLPEGLARVPGLGGRYLIVVNDIDACVCEHQASDRLAYRYQEVVPFIPCVSRAGALGLFTPELYPSAYMPILLGREVYGFPKRLGRIRLGERRVDLIADNDVLLCARWTEERAASIGDTIVALVRALLSALTSRVFVRKRIRSAASLDLDACAIDELVEIPFDVFHLGDPAHLDGARVETAPSNRVFPGRLVAAFSSSIGFRFGAGRVLRSYLPEPPRRGLRSLVSPLLRTAR